MLTNFEPKFQIQTPAWESFKKCINDTYPRMSFTHEQKEFVTKFLKQDEGVCSDLNKLWINYVADQLIEYADNWPASHEAISEQLERLQAITGKAILGLFNVQYMIRQMVPAGSRTPEQVRLLEIHPHLLNYPVELMVDIGRLLNLPHHCTRSQDPDAKAEEQQLFHQLHNFIVQSSQGDGETVTRSTSEEQGDVGEWDPHSAEDTYMRLCCYKVWCDKYEEENEWSAVKMMGPWLREAMQLYNKVSYHWPHCKIKRFDDSQFQNIRHTAHHSWLAEIPHRAKIVGKAKKPNTNWVTDWCTYPVTEKRHEWEMYFCSVMLHAKNLARLLNKREYVHEGEVEEEQEPMKKRAKAAEGTILEGDENSTEVKLARFISNEFHQLRHNLVLVDRNASVRHQENLREMLGHFNPVRNQLQHLSNGQQHIVRTLDKAVTTSTSSSSKK